MRNINYCLLLLLLVVIGCSKDASLSNNGLDSIVKVYDFNTSSVNKCNDGGFILGTNFGLVKLNSLGVIEWKKNYAEYNSDTVKFNYTKETRVFQNLDGGYTAMNIGFLKKQDLFYYCLIKTDALGNKVAVLPFYFPGVNPLMENNYFIIENADKGYVITFGYNNGDNRVLFKTNLNGLVVWMKKDLQIFGTTSNVNGEVFDMIVLPNDEFALTGYCYKLKYTYFGKYTSVLGDLVSEKRYAMGGRDEVGGLVTSLGTKLNSTNSSNLLIFGDADRGNSTKVNFEYSIIKINSNGDSLTSTVLGTSKQDYCFYGTQTSDNGFALIGTSTTVLYDPSQPFFKPTMYFLKLDQNMHVQKSFNFGENLDTQGLFVKENSNKSFTIIGNKVGYQNLGKSQTIFIITAPTGGL